MVASYLANPSRRGHDLSTDVYNHLGTGESGQLTLEEQDRASGAAVAAQQIAALREQVTEALEERKQWELFAELEMPLVPVLMEMELAGVAVDVEALSALSERLGKRIGELETDIHALAGEEFTIASPKQLRVILFDKLQLPPDKTKRTKTGYSTGADVLAGLSEHEIVARIVEYREVTKLKSTYVDALPRLVHEETGRLHTSLNQAVTATGRLSSSDPNLQNIPVRSELGMEIRRAFVPGDEGHVLLSGDYSQIELRILAHITGDENLAAVFLRDEDLHRAAAVEIFGVEAEGVTPQMRAFAKMVNFGIPYGISEFRLAREMGISREEAGRYVQRYFARFPKVQEYMREIPERARETGYVETLLGRRRYLPDLRAGAAPVRSAAERMAINTPMQGTAADIIKLAMLRVHGELASSGLGSKMILQVHDELLLEVPQSETEITGELVRRCMGQAYELRVPLKVDVKAGHNWLEMGPL
jgi:DNA polymerase-1